MDCSDGFDESKCLNNSMNDPDTVFKPGWQEPYQSIIDDPDIYKYFKDNVFINPGYQRVKGEDPPDWLRFKSFSKSPDYTELADVLKVNTDEIAAMGHQAEDFILQCTYGGEVCHPRSDFVITQDEVYGNCFHFNADPNKDTRFTRGTGTAHGLSLVLFTEQYEYLGIYGQDSATVVSIVPRNLRPFPVDHGFFAMPGTATSVSLTESKIHRQNQPYGNCTDETSNLHFTDNVKKDSSDKMYSIVSCEKACFRKVLLDYCGCTDSVNINAPSCRILNDTQVVCVQLMLFFFQSNLLPCDCPPPCRETKYQMTISESKWPSDAYLDNLLKLVKVKNQKTRNLNDLESARSNLVRLKVYFESLNYESTSEHPAYTWEDLLSDVGGTLGLYIGLSVITVCEICRFVIDICLLCSRRKDKLPLKGVAV
ncbi:amiloride-sensitive sodium channel subunit beta-like [Ptychodera flava]|uniref:amiloride-sensitive sodium channel subunit beta-like n=1 Tax=Ptychodera flava TaxID=63121 RepID=UPI003969BE44